MNEFYTVKDEKVIEIEVEKSKFIGILIPFFNKDNLKNNRTCTTTTIVKSLSYATTGWFGASSNACRYMDWAAIGY